MRRDALVGLGPLILLCGCLAKTDTPPIRFFRPVLGERAPAAAPAALPPVHLDPVTAADHLREPVVWQDAGVEYGFYPDRHWTATPDRFLEEALRHELFGAHGHAGRRGEGIVITAHLTAFEEARRPEHQAVVAARITLKDASRLPLTQRTFTARRPLADEDPTTLARELGAALSDLAAEVGEWLADSKR